MCAIAALAEYPHFIERIFTLPGEERPQEANAAGFYQLRLCNSGEWTTIRLDDIFPCFPGGGPVFSKANGDELWVLLLEKVGDGGGGYVHWRAQQCSLFPNTTSASASASTLARPTRPLRRSTATTTPCAAD